MLHIVSAGKGMEVSCVVVAPTETMTGFSSHFWYRSVMKYAAVATASMKDIAQNILQ